MKSIKTDFRTNRALNPEHFELHAQFMEIATESFAQANGLGELYATYAALYATEDECFQRSRAMENTAEVERLDGERDAIFSFINKVATSATLLPMAEIAQAATRISTLLTRYKGISTQPYNANSGSLRDFLSQMATQPLAADAATLSLTHIIEALRTTNEAFIQVFGLRTKEAQQRAAEKMKTIRPKVDQAAIAYFTAINALYQLNEVIAKDPQKREQLGIVIDDLNARIDQFLKDVARRNGTPLPATEDEPTPDTPEGESNTPGETDNENGTGNNTPTPGDNTGETGGNTGETGGNTGETGGNTGETPGSDNENTGGGNEGGTTPPPPAGNDDDEEIIG